MSYFYFISLLSLYYNSLILAFVFFLDIRSMDMDTGHGYGHDPDRSICNFFEM